VGKCASNYYENIFIIIHYTDLTIS